MNLCILIACIILFQQLRDIKSVEFHQQQSTVRYFNPRYLANVSIITVRPRRNAPYTTSFTAILLTSLNNNVTMTFSVFHGHTTTNTNLLVEIKYKICDALNTPWIAHFAKKYSNIPVQCPVHKGNFTLKDIRVMSHQLPVAISINKFTLSFIFNVTNTHELMLDTYEFLTVK